MTDARIEIDLDKACTRCGAFGVSPRGLCLECIGKEWNEPVTDWRPRMADPDVRPALTLEGLAQGASADLWSAALTRVLENIEDPNTDWKAVRVVTLEYRFRSDENRQVGDVEIKCSQKLAGMRGVKTTVSYGMRSGERIAVEHYHQNELFPANQQQGKPQAVKAAGSGT
jgi:hypothetical protein